MNSNGASRSSFQDSTTRVAEKIAFWEERRAQKWSCMHLLHWQFPPFQPSHSSHTYRSFSKLLQTENEIFLTSSRSVPLHWQDLWLCETCSQLNSWNCIRKILCKTEGQLNISPRIPDSEAADNQGVTSTTLHCRRAPQNQICTAVSFS